VCPSFARCLRGVGTGDDDALFRAVFAGFANAVAIFRSEDGSLVVQNDANIKLLGSAVADLRSLFASNPASLNEAMTAISKGGIWRGEVEPDRVVSSPCHSKCTFTDELLCRTRGARLAVVRVRAPSDSSGSVLRAAVFGASHAVDPYLWSGMHSLLSAGAKARYYTICSGRTGCSFPLGSRL
jgi:hypothetical protein